MSGVDNKLDDYQKITKGFRIFQQYPDHEHEVAATNNQIWAGPPPDEVTDEHQAKLEDLGWAPDDYNDCFVYDAN